MALRAGHLAQRLLQHHAVDGPQRGHVDDVVHGLVVAQLEGVVAKLHVGHAHVGLAPATLVLFADGAGVPHRHEALQRGLGADAVLEGVVARQALQRHHAFLLDVQQAAQALAEAQGRRILRAQARDAAATALRPYVLARLVEVALVRKDDSAAIGRLRVLRAALRRSGAHPDWIDAVMMRADAATTARQNAEAGAAISATCRAFGVDTSDARINFDSASAAISPAAEADLAQIAANLAANPAITAGGCRMRVRGHTDASGSDAINDPLSLARARAVVTALLAASPALAGHLIPEGAGRHEPLYPGNDPAAWALNRRVELVEACPP